MKFALAVLFCTALALPAFCDSITVLGGYVEPRAKSDVFTQNEIETFFEKSDLNSGGVTVRYDHFVGEYVNLGGGFTFYEADTTAEDRDFELEDGSPILHDIRLRIAPLEFNVHILPLGREAAVIPYLGGGAGAYFWRYEEVGDFVFDRFTHPHVVTGSAFSDGVDPGWHAEGGVYIPIARRFAIVAEAKYWQAKGHLDRSGFDPNFGKIDLSAWMFSGGASFWF